MIIVKDKINNCFICEDGKNKLSWTGNKNWAYHFENIFDAKMALSNLDLPITEEFEFIEE